MRIWPCARSKAYTNGFATRRGRSTWPPAEVPGDFDVTQLLSREPTPDEAAELADECRRLLDALAEPELRQIALWKVEGYTNEEIAARLDCVPRTVERKVSRIRLLWQHELEERVT
jgi:RNA polymerase sigma factor (sigma-70 family)